jgi:circadian clock protein KaiB
MNKPPHFKFLLYVAGDASNSTEAISNLNALCREHLPERHEIEIVDVFREPKRAMAEGVLLTPMLVRVSPDPIRKIIGNLSQIKPLMQMLELLP